MASIGRSVRSASRLLSAARLTATSSRTYADQMSFTLAAANQETPRSDDESVIFKLAPQVFYANQSVKQVDVPSFSGSFGILADHVPTLAVLKPGVITVYEDDGKVKKVFVSSGTVTINEDSSVQVLAEEAHPIENLDLSAAKEALSSAQNSLASAKDDKERAEAAIEVETAEAVVQAISG